MKRHIPIFIGLWCVIALAGVCVCGQTKVADFTSISKSEIEMLLVDVAKTNPKILERLANDPEMKKQQIENLKQLLAFASQAQRDGLRNEPTNRQELDSIRAEVLAVNYDREVNKAKSSTVPFGLITANQVAAYWREDEMPKKGVSNGGTSENRTHAAEFNDFLKAKIEILGAGDPEGKKRELSAEERTQARDVFAKIRIYKAEYERRVKTGKLTQEFVDKANLQVKLQQAQFLARLYSEVLSKAADVTDSDVAKYIAEHAELSPTVKKAKAEDILTRAKAGDDFVRLANEFTEDPGNIDAKGVAQGGIYRDVPRGRMVAVFENAALALEPGQVAPNVVESEFGYHIIKLEKKGKGVDGGVIYDAQHILISTMYKDPKQPSAMGKPVKEYVREKLKTDREKFLTDNIIAENNIQVPDDFTIPVVGVEPPPKVEKKVPVKKKRPVKKRR